MIIEKKPQYRRALQSILRYIAKDKISASLRFERELEKKIFALMDFPYQNRASYYFENDAYRDMIFKGYTIIYKIEKDKIVILDIFKWQDK